MSQITHQPGGGIFSGILAAIIPIIKSLVSRFLNEKKQKKIL